MGATCPVCFESYSNFLPIMLECGQTMCKSCAKAIAAYFKSTNVECPSCRTVTDIRGKVDNVALQVTTRRAARLGYQARQGLKKENKEKKRKRRRQRIENTHDRPLCVFWICGAYIDNQASF